MKSYSVAILVFLSLLLSSSSASETLDHHHHRDDNNNNNNNNNNNKAIVHQCPWYLPDFLTWFTYVTLKSGDTIVFGANAVVYKVNAEGGDSCDTSNGIAVLQDGNGYNSVTLSSGNYCYLQSQQLCMEGLKLCVNL